MTIISLIFMNNQTTHNGNFKSILGKAIDDILFIDIDTLKITYAYLGIKIELNPCAAKYLI